MVVQSAYIHNWEHVCIHIYDMMSSSGKTSTFFPSWTGRRERGKGSTAEFLLMVFVVIAKAMVSCVCVYVCAYFTSIHENQANVSSSVFHLNFPFDALYGLFRFVVPNIANTKHKQLQNDDEREKKWTAFMSKFMWQCRDLWICPVSVI